jgi:hypothetical protein
MGHRPMSTLSWGSHFYWLCNCNSLKELLDYNGGIHQICRIAQELLGYFFFFRPQTSAHDARRRRVESLLRPLIKAYEERREAMRVNDHQLHPNLYDPASFPEHAVKCPDTKQTDTLTAAVAPYSNTHTQSMLTSATRLLLTTSLHGTNYPVRMLPALHAGKHNPTRSQAI